MNKKACQFWLEYEYPVTILKDRYTGAYSGGEWVAYPEHADELSGPEGCDIDCMEFWNDPPFPTGKGSTPQEALDNLIKAVRNTGYGGAE